MRCSQHQSLRRFGMLAFASLLGDSLKAAGASVKEVSLPPLLEDAWRAHKVIILYEAARSYAFEYDNKRDLLGPKTASMLDEAKTVSVDAYDDARRIALDLHPPAAAVAELAPRHVGVDAPAVELEPGRQALDHAGQARTVRLAGRDELQRHRAPKSMGGPPELAVV